MIHGIRMQPQGVLIVTTINRTPVAFAKTVLAAEYILRWVPKGK
jgi:2-polyprenyl-6-hydroxyphenyl methylase/3-demethylubiquinone-9 3-methyltransferase